MPKTKFQGFIFGLIMSYAMAFGMEMYNVSIKMGFNLNTGGFSTLDWSIFPGVLIETAYMGVFVLIFSNLWGNRIGAAFANRHADPKKDNPYFYRLMRQAGTVAIMCPTMSLVATFLFNIIMGHAPLYLFPMIWVGTVMKNFPMAFFWNMFAAAPFTNFVFGKIFAPEKMQEKSMA